MDKEILNYPTEKGKPRNNSTLGFADCCMRLMDKNLPFETMNDDDLDSLYAVAFGRWAYHLTRQGYIDALNKYRQESRTFTEHKENLNISVMKKLEAKYMLSLKCWRSSKSKRDAEVVCLLEKILEDDFGYTSDDIDLLKVFSLNYKP